ncbi:hypothetical protein AB0I00_07455 [Streptomyces sp. NPDC050803]|uniref:hypothetical protein n=1 Tax=unclassified Streptomyces TaxID=2593676 RepID=UPI0034212337
MEERSGNKFRARDGFGLAGAVLVGAAFVAVILLVLGLWKRFARATAPTLVDLPGGSWAAGGVLGLVSVLGGLGGLWFLFTAPDRTGVQRALRAVGSGVCWVGAFGPLFNLFSSLPGKNCHSSGPRCAYIPGTGSALLAYVITAVLTGWLLLRIDDAVAEKRAARERTRMRNLRKKGKGKSRAARERMR